MWVDDGTIFGTIYDIGGAGDYDCGSGYLYTVSYDGTWSGCEADDEFPDEVGAVQLPFQLYTFDIKSQHFWAKHLACYLASTVGEYGQQTVVNFDGNYTSGNVPSAIYAPVDYRYSFNDRGRPQDLVYRVVRAPTTGLIEHFENTTAFIPGTRNCPGY